MMSTVSRALPTPTCASGGPRPCVAARTASRALPRPLAGARVNGGRSHSNLVCRAEEPEVSVFRFTLGIEGFDDALIPRVVGGLALAAIGANHLATGDAITDAQGRVELLGATLAALCMAAPSLEARLKELSPGRGRQAAEAVAGATNCFALDESLPEAQQQEVAWASFALLKNCNACSVLLHKGGKTLLARGAFPPNVVQAGGPAAAAAGLTPVVEEGLEKWSGDLQEANYYPDAMSLFQANVDAWEFVPYPGVQSVLLRPVGKDGVLVLMSDRPRALSSRERAWAAAVGKKLEGALA